MKIQCDFCGSYIDDTNEFCPNCGAVNSHFVRVGNGAPQTIEELRQWYVAHNLPPEHVTRFFIGKDIKEARAFGIYKDNSNFVVYKNKDDGSRAVRYEGPDEAYAVNELYLKLKERIAEEKARNSATRELHSHNSGRNFWKIIKRRLIGIVIFYVVVIIVAMLLPEGPSRGYYNYEGSSYYYLDNNWYVYDDYLSDWSRTTVPSGLKENSEQYYNSTIYDSNSGASDFSDTSYYSNWVDSQESNSSDWDSGSSWDSGDSWDSGGGDWGSDW